MSRQIIQGIGAALFALLFLGLASVLSLALVFSVALALNGYPLLFAFPVGIWAFTTWAIFRKDGWDRL